MAAKVQERSYEGYSQHVPITKAMNVQRVQKLVDSGNYILAVPKYYGNLLTLTYHTKVTAEISAKAILIEKSVFKGHGPLLAWCIKGNVGKGIESITLEEVTEKLVKRLEKNPDSDYNTIEATAKK